MTARLDYEALVAGLPDAVVGVDAELRIVLWNPAAEALLGRSARRVTGRIAAAMRRISSAEAVLARSWIKSAPPEDRLYFRMCRLPTSRAAR